MRQCIEKTVLRAVRDGTVNERKGFIMKGLLYKEFCMFKPQFKSWAFVLIFFLSYTVLFLRTYI